MAGLAPPAEASSAAAVGSAAAAVGSAAGQMVKPSFLEQLTSLLEPEPVAEKPNLLEHLPMETGDDGEQGGETFNIEEELTVMIEEEMALVLASSCPATGSGSRRGSSGSAEGPGE